jgi:hypothetical protein
MVSPEALSRSVLGRVGQGARVAVPAHASHLEPMLRASGCTVLVEPTGDGAPGLKAFGPTHVLLPAPSSERELEALLTRAQEAAPGAELLLCVRQAGASSRVLEALVGRTVGPALSDAEVVRCVQARGLRIAHREALVDGHRRVTSLAEDTEAALHALLAQLNPTAGGEFLFYALTPDAPASRETPEAPVPELLSVILLADGASAPALDETLLSLAGQEYEPFEVLLASRAPTFEQEALRRRLATYQRLGGGSFQLVAGADAPAEALSRARGRYVAFLSPDVVVYPDHYVQLVRALREGGAAWSVARARHALTALSSEGPVYIEAKRPFPLGDWLELGHLRDEPALLYALVLDRERLGPFSLTPLPALPLRLGALFRPHFLAGLASCEVRTPAGQPPRGPEAPPALQVLVPLHTLEERVERARQSGESAKDLRHKTVDALNARLRESAPWLHGALRRLASRRR